MPLALQTAARADLPPERCFSQHERFVCVCVCENAAPAQGVAAASLLTEQTNLRSVFLTQ